MQNEEFIKDFIDEALSHLDNMESSLLKLEDAEYDSEIINNIFRSVHSIKGTAGFFALKNIVELSHAMESLFGRLRNESSELAPGMIDQLLDANDALRSMVSNVKESDDMDISSYIVKLAELNVEESTAASETDVYNVSRLDLDMNENEPALLKNNSTSEKLIDTSGQAVLKNNANNDKRADESIRVHTEVLNELMNLASELVLGRNQLLRTVDSYRKKIPGLDSILQNIDHITTELQEKVMQTRMQPISGVFNRIPRVIRELSRRLGKEIQMKIEGTEVELDKSIIEALNDPLMHLIRNAVDHGIEAPAERIKAGKAETGTIIIRAYHEAGYVYVEIEDDGGGISLDKVKEKALNKGLVSADELMSMADDEIIYFLFKPGFSTSDAVTDVSGRGVGMDVVKTNIEKLGGSVSVETMLHMGTTFRLQLPLTLAIISSLIVEAEGLKFALPQVNLQEMVRIKPRDERRRIELIQGAMVLRLRDQLVPVISLSSALHGSSSACKVDFDTVIRILILKLGEKRYGLIVDKIFDNEEILVKPIPKYFNNLPCYSGVTILGDGMPAMILDVEGIAAKTALEFPDTNEDAALVSGLASIYEQKNYLLFKCSGTESFGIDLESIARVEEALCSNIQLIGRDEFIEYRGSPLKVIRPENYLPMGRESKEREKLYILIPKNTEKPVGIAAEAIFGTVNAAPSYDTDSLKHKGVRGTMILQNRIIILLNIPELLELAETKIGNELYGGAVHA